MTWFKVDDNLAFHRKAVAAGNAAMGLWVRAGSLCAQQLTDGFLDAAIARQMGTKREIGALVRVGLWIEVEGGYQFHQWNEPGRQPTREQVEHERKLKTDRQRRWRDGSTGRYGRRDVDVDASVDASTSTRGRGSSHDVLTKNSQDHDEIATKNGARSSRRFSHDADTYPQASGFVDGDVDASTDASRDGRPVPSRPDPTNRSLTASVEKGSLSSSLTVRTARDAATDDDLKIEQKIIDLLAELTGRTVMPDWARRVRMQLLDGRDVAKPITYVTRAINERPRDFLPSALRPDAPPPNPLAGMPDPPPLGQRDNPANGPGLAAARAAIAAARKEET